MPVLIGYTSYNRWAYTAKTLPALLDWAARTEADVEVVVVDDASTDGSGPHLRRLWDGRGEHFPPWPHWKALIIQPERQGHAVASNLAWRQTNGDYIKWDNDVMALRDDWLDVLLAYAAGLPDAGVVAHNCEITLHRPYPEQRVNGLKVARRPTVAGACALIPAATREKCGRWNERERGQQFNRGADLLYSVKVRLAGLNEYYTSGEKNRWVRCLVGGDGTQYASERARFKRAVPTWAYPVARAYRAGKRPINDVP